MGQLLGINNFLKAFKDGLRPNLFYVQLGNLPTVTGMPSSRIDSTTIGTVTENSSNYGLENFQFYCKSASLPASSIGTVEVPFMGRSIKVAGNRTFEDWTVTVYNAVYTGAEGESSNKSLRLPFEKWLALINSHDFNTGFNRIKSYKTDAVIAQLDQRGNKIATYRMRGIFPTEVSSIDLAWDSNDTIEEFTVTFALGEFWTINNPDGLKKNINEGVGAGKMV